MKATNVVMATSGGCPRNFIASSPFYDSSSLMTRQSKLVVSLFTRIFLLWCNLPAAIFLIMLLLLGAHTISAQIIPSSLTADEKLLASIDSTCQKKGHCGPFDVTVLKHKDVTETTCLKDFARADTDVKRYQLINAYLTVAELYLRSSDESRQCSGVYIAWQAAKTAGQKLHENIIAANICTLMIKPYLAKLPYNASEYFSFERIANSLITIFSNVHDDISLVAIYRLILDSDCDNAMKDHTRLLYASGLAHHGNYARAIEILQDINSDGMAGETQLEIDKYSKLLDAQHKVNTVKGAKL